MVIADVDAFNVALAVASERGELVAVAIHLFDIIQVLHAKAGQTTLVAFEFCESRNASSASGNNAPDADGFVNIPDNVEDEALPFN